MIRRSLIKLIIKLKN